MDTVQNEAIEALITPIKKEWLSPKEVNKEFGFSVSSLAKFRMTNKHLSFYKMGKYIKYKRSDIVEFIEAHKIVKVA